MSEKFSVSHLDEIEPEEGADEARWYRLRRDLDVGAFGVNAYGADSGKRVIEEHDELGTAAGRHQELYFVLRGRVRFRLGEDEHTLGEEQMVFIEDPAIRRTAFAEEDGTVVLVVGGTPGVPYSVSAWEAAAHAYPLWEAGEIGQAVEILRSVVDKYPNAGIVLYNLACAEVLHGEPDPAMDHLRRAVDLEDRFRDLARNDEDFDAVRDRAEFQELVA